MNMTDNWADYKVNDTTVVLKKHVSENDPDAFICEGLVFHDDESKQAWAFQNAYDLVYWGGSTWVNGVPTNFELRYWYVAKPNKTGEYKYPVRGYGKDPNQPWLPLPRTERHILVSADELAVLKTLPTMLIHDLYNTPMNSGDGGIEVIRGGGF